MAKMRSPNYPAASLGQAIESARALWMKEKRTIVAPLVAVKAMGYGSMNGPARSRISALRKYGLLDETDEGVRLSELAMFLLHNPPDSIEYRSAIQAAAMKPDLFRELWESHPHASDDALKSHLLVKRGFSDLGAKQVIQAFRDTVSIAKLEEGGYSHPPVGAKAMPATLSVEAARPVPEPGRRMHVFSWPLAKDVDAEVRVTGPEIKAAHLERLRQYLELAKAALEGEDA
jgi:hypothetical protein